MQYITNIFSITHGVPSENSVIVRRRDEGETKKDDFQR